MVLRKAGYEGAVYRIQYDQTSIYPFVSMVLYWGEGVWNAPRNIRQLFDMDGMREGEFIDDIRLHVYEMTSLPREVRQRFQSDMRRLYLKCKKRRKKKDKLTRVNELIRHLIGDGRSAEIEKAVSDVEYQNQLFFEYHL